MKRIVYYTIILLQIYHTCSGAINLGSLWPKNEKEQIKQEYAVKEDCIITLYNTEGSITIKEWPHAKIAIEAVKQGTKQEQLQTTIGAQASEKEARITTRVKQDQKSSKVDYMLMVPEKATIKITQTHGPVSVRGVQGSLDISLENGAIDITESTASVIAKTGAGAITVKQKKFGQPHTLFLESLKGNIELYLPRETKALVHAKAGIGNITSDHPVTLAPVTMKLNKANWERMKKEVDGALGGVEGGAPITIEVTKGDIVIKEY